MSQVTSMELLKLPFAVYRALIFSLSRFLQYSSPSSTADSDYVYVLLLATNLLFAFLTLHSSKRNKFIFCFLDFYFRFCACIVILTELRILPGCNISWVGCAMLFTKFRIGLSLHPKFSNNFYGYFKVLFAIKINYCEEQLLSMKQE